MKDRLLQSPASEVERQCRIAESVIDVNHSHWNRLSEAQRTVQDGPIIAELSNQIRVLVALLRSHEATS